MKLLLLVHDVCSRKPGTEVYDPFSSNGMLNLKRLPIPLDEDMIQFVLTLDSRFKQGCHTNEQCHFSLKA